MWFCGTLINKYMGHILVVGKKRFGNSVRNKKWFYKTMKGAIRIFDGDVHDSINISCEIETKEEVESLIKFLEISKHCFNK